MKDRNEERRQYHGDVTYDVWRRGGNPDRVDYDRVDDAYYNGEQSEDAASREIRKQRPHPQEQEEYPEEQFPGEEGAA